MTKPTPIIARSLRSGGCAECTLNSVCLPPALDEKTLEQLTALITQPVPLARGDMLFRQGEPFSSIYAVRSGAIKTSVIPKDGEEQIMGFYLPGEIIGFDSMGPGAHVSSATALETTAICAVPFSRMEKLAQEMPGLQRHLFDLMSAEIQAGQQLMLLLGKRSAEARLAAFLTSLSARQHRRRLSAERLHLPMSRTDIANHLGLTLETISRLFNRLQQSGVLKARGRDITLLTPETLGHLSEPECHEEISHI